ncbi:hypothetical protein H8E77_27380 [bacterium]|nr:hypothetical protein [bacterium]
MRLKEKLIKEIDKLNSREIVEIYKLVLVVKSQEKINQESNPKQGYLRVRNALRNYCGRLSDEIRAEREER